MTDDFNIDSHKQWDFFMHGILIFWDPLVGIAANHWLSTYTPPSEISRFRDRGLNVMNISPIFPPVFLRREAMRAVLIQPKNSRKLVLTRLE
jgi:hypothetical protein